MIFLTNETDERESSEMKKTIVFLLLMPILTISESFAFELTDAMVAMRILTGLETGSAINSVSDINSDGKIGLEEAIYILQDIAGLRTITYYVAIDGDDSWEGSSERPWATFAHAFSQIQPGSTLIIKDGEYHQDLRSYYGNGFPPGTPHAFTTIRAENDWKVKVYGELRVAPASTGYFIIRGIHFMNSHAGIYCHHAKLIRCSFRGTTCEGNTTVISAGTGSRYVLLEECFAYGCGRYKFMAYGDQNTTTEKIIFRRCVSRHDYHQPDPGWGRQSATYTSYDAHDFVMQNSISIDSGHDDPSLYGRLYGGVWFENKETTPSDNSGRIQGSIFLNLGGLAAIHDPKNNGVRVIENSVIWNSKGGYVGSVISGTPTLSLNHMTIGSIWGVFQDMSYAWGTGAVAADGFDGGPMITNSILTACNSYGIANYMGSDYNIYHANSANFGNSWGVTPPTAGPNDRFSDPGLKYLPRIEADSPLVGAASDGTNIGANIIYRRGKSGTLYGEPGWDELTDEPLWPFPNENVIKETMAQWDGENDARRGFCAEGTGLYGGPITLTSYIWEYLGSPCPAEICGE